MSVAPNETIEFKIKTHSPSYRIDIYRMGWYGGNGARLIQTIQPSTPLPQAQPECLTAPQGLVDCGNWRVSASWRVPADAVSGVYVARIVRTDNEPEPWRSEGNATMPYERPPSEGPHSYGYNGLGQLEDAMKEKRASHIVFVVRDDAGRSEILFQTADPTWVAFNRYGGSSLYGGPGAANNPRQRAYMASYNRPLDNRRTAFANQFFSAEFPLVRWLERNGYDVSYFAGIDADRRGEEIREHRIFVSAGHDTYWSANQRRNVEAARDGGVHLAFLSGGVGMWKSRYRTGIDGNPNPHRTLVSYRETLADGKLDPIKNVWTGSWRDSRIFNPEGARPENALVGTIHTVGSARLDRIAVTPQFGRLRFWRNTELAKLPDGQETMLGRGVLGHEWDEDLDNGARPAGLIRLSETTVDGVPYIQDWGSTYDSGTATHAMTLYRAQSGALVFSAGSVQYSWGLDDLHTFFTASGRVRPDPMGAVRPMQQATVNLFADMGVQPATLQQDLMRAEPSTDRTGPLADITTPADNAIVGGIVTVTGTAADAEGLVGGVEVSVDGGATWHPAQGTSRWTFAWTVPADVEEAVILARAADDSVNLGPVSEPVRVRRSGSSTSQQTQHSGSVR
jgi:hypothetical protein